MSREISMPCSRWPRTINTGFASLTASSNSTLNSARASVNFVEWSAGWGFAGSMAGRDYDRYAYRPYNLRTLYTELSRFASTGAALPSSMMASTDHDLMSQQRLRGKQVRRA